MVLNASLSVPFTANEIETLYPKKEKGIIFWILNDKIANVDKKKALHWIEELQPHAETEQSKKDLLDAAKIIKGFDISKLSNGKIREQRKISDTPEEKEKTGLIFDTAKNKFGLTSDIREAGYILPDGTMLDFSGRHELFGADDSDISGSFKRFTICTIYSRVPVSFSRSSAISRHFLSMAARVTALLQSVTTTHRLTDWRGR